MKSGLHICTACNHIYEEPQCPVECGCDTSFDALPEQWRCPECGADKETYQPCSCVSLGEHNRASQGDRLGITAEEIQAVVFEFYSKVRKDSVLGPIFDSQMTEDWDHHLQKMCNFWTTVLFAKPVYKGNPLEVHRHVEGISAAHFDRWLLLFERTLWEVCPNRKHVEAFRERANNMAQALTSAIALNKIPKEALC